MSTNLKNYWRNQAVEQLVAIFGTANKEAGQYRGMLAKMTDTQLLAEQRGAVADMDGGNEPFTIREDNIVSVCGDCFPGRSIFDIFPDLAGHDISHGICQRHMRRFKMKLQLLPTYKAAEATTETATAQPLMLEVGAL